MENSNIRVDTLKFKATRNAKGWTQKTLAKKSGYAESVIQKIEQGRYRGLPCLEVCAKALDVPLAELTVTTMLHEEQRQDHHPDSNQHLGEFVFTISNLGKGQRIRPADLPLRVEGRYQGTPPIEVRVVLRDDYGNLYVQNPEVLMLPDGKWFATNILPGQGITGILFLRNNDEARTWFKNRVARKQWGAFRELPEGSQIITYVPVSVSEE